MGPVVAEDQISRFLAIEIAGPARQQWHATSGASETNSERDTAQFHRVHFASKRAFRRPLLASTYPRLRDFRDRPLDQFKDCAMGQTKARDYPLSARPELGYHPQPTNFHGHIKSGIQ